MKSPTIHRVLVDTDGKGIAGWWTHGFMSPTHQLETCLKKRRNVDKKHCVYSGKNVTRYIVKDF